MASQSRSLVGSESRSTSEPGVFKCLSILLPPWMLTMSWLPVSGIPNTAIERANGVIRHLS